MSEEKRTIRVPLLLTPEEAKELDDWQFSNRLRTRSDALREMMRRAIRQSREHPSGQERPDRP
jgi:metal-responsive CopG/Arc/MetJ family transcriptional regulator